MEECLKSGINLLLIFVLSYSLARHSILWKNAFETIQAVFWSFCFAIKNHNGPKRRRTSRTMRHSVPDVKYPLPKFGRTQKAKLGLWGTQQSRLFRFAFCPPLFFLFTCPFLFLFSSKGRFPFVRADRPVHSCRDEKFTFNHNYSIILVKQYAWRKGFFHKNVLDKHFSVSKWLVRLWSGRPVLTFGKRPSF